MTVIPEYPLTGPHSAYVGRRPVARPALPPAPPTTVAVIEGVATGAPEQVFTQREAAEEVAALFDDPKQRQRIRRVYDKTRINERHLAINPTDPEFRAFSQERATIRQRMNLYLEHAAPLAVDVARRALGAVPGEVQVGLLVFVTSTGFIAPGVDVAVIKELGLPRTTSRVVVNFMGCAAAMNGIRMATDFVRANPDKKALVVCLEISSVNAVFADDINEVITHSLFGDGCGAVVVGASEVHHPIPAGNIVIRDTFSHLLDDAEDGIVLGVNHNGITCELAANLPGYIYRGVDPVISAILRSHGLDKSDIELWAIHPGGPKIIDESAHSLGIDPARAEASWDILARYGNMLSVSLIFVLEQMAKRTADANKVSTGIAFSFAPGVTLEGLLFDIVRK